MSTPTHDPLVVNTQDGSTWLCRAVTRGGKGLYALAGTVPGAPDMVLATLAELAEHGLASVAFAMPMPMPVGRELTEVERLRARLAELEGQRAALAERLRAGQTWRLGRNRGLVSEDLVSQPELRAMFAIPLAAPWDGADRADGITRRIAPTQALRADAEDVSPQVAKLRGLLAGQRAAVEDPHDGPLAHRYLVPRDLPPLDGAR